MINEKSTPKNKANRFSINNQNKKEPIKDIKKA
jgi:hypothetical protein